MKPRRYFVCLDEIRQNFVFGERFRDSYIRTVTLSDGSTRTIKLTPTVRDGQEYVELNDSGHISYMGLGGTTTKGPMMVHVWSLELAYPDEQSCANAMLAAPMVQELYQSLGTDPDTVKACLNDMQSAGDNPDIDFVLATEKDRHGHAPPFPLEIRTLIGLVLRGSPEVKQALTPRGGKPGDIPFFVAHQQREAELESLWPAVDQQTGRAVLLDDPFTSMRVATDELEVSFGLDPKSAHSKMLEVHTAGSCVLELEPGNDVAGTCRRLNAGWRSRGLPLYCHPQRADAVAV